MVANLDCFIKKRVKTKRPTIQYPNSCFRILGVQILDVHCIQMSTVYPITNASYSNVKTGLKPVLFFSKFLYYRVTFFSFAWLKNMFCVRLERPSNRFHLAAKFIWPRSEVGGFHLWLLHLLKVLFIGSHVFPSLQILKGLFIRSHVFPSLQILKALFIRSHVLPSMQILKAFLVTCSNIICCMNLCKIFRG